MSGNGQTTPQAKGGKKPNWRCGAPAGNANAKKPVLALSTIRRRVRALKRRAKAVIAGVGP